MKSIIIITAVLASISAHAGVYRCQGAGGKITYSDQPCTEGGTTLSPNSLNGNSAGTVRTPAPQQPRAWQAAPPAVNCPTESEIRNIQVSASVRFHPAHREEVFQEQIARAKACQPLLTENEMAAMDLQLKTQALDRAREQAQSNPILTSCDAGGCWDNSGRRYTGSGTTFFRSDGATCTKVGPNLQCN